MSLTMGMSRLGLSMLLRAQRRPQNRAFWRVHKNLQPLLREEIDQTRGIEKAKQPSLPIHYSRDAAPVIRLSLTDIFTRGATLLMKLMIMQRSKTKACSSCISRYQSFE